MSKNITVDPVKCVLLALFAGCFLISALALMTVGSRIAALLCLALAFVYLAGAAANAAVVHVDEQGISRRLLWFPPKSYRWDELHEVGVFGTKLFNRRDPSKVGTLYLYVSKEPLTDDQRFNMVLRWHFKQIYFAFQPSLLTLIRRFWGGKIVGYNVGDLVL